jgi:hypothetical protein
MENTQEIASEKVNTSAIASDKSKKPAAKQNYKYLRDKDREQVQGIFRFFEVPGGTMNFSIKIWKEDQVENYALQDGAVYTLPLGVAKHLNKNCWYPIHAHASDEKGNQQQKVGQRVRRMGFQSLEFIDIEDLTTKDGNSIVEYTTPQTLR